MQGKIWKPSRGESKFIYANDPIGANGGEHYFPLWPVGFPLLACGLVQYAEGMGQLLYLPSAISIGADAAVLWTAYWLAGMLGFFIASRFYAKAVTPSQVGNKYFKTAARSIAFYSIVGLVGFQDFGFNATKDFMSGSVALAIWIGPLLVIHFGSAMSARPSWVACKHPSGQQMSLGRIKGVEDPIDWLPGELRTAPTMRQLGLSPDRSVSTAKTMATVSAAGLAIVGLGFVLAFYMAGQHRVEAIAAFGALAIAWGWASTVYTANMDVIEHDAIINSPLDQGEPGIVKFRKRTRQASRWVNPFLLGESKPSPAGYQGKSFSPAPRQD